MTEDTPAQRGRIPQKAYAIGIVVVLGLVFLLSEFLFPRPRMSRITFSKRRPMNSRVTGNRLLESTRWRFNWSWA